MYGNSGNNYLSGGRSNDKLYGEAGNDTLRGWEDNDIFDGGLGDDSLKGGTGNDTLYGSDCNDNLSDGFGNNYLYGGVGNDSLNAEDSTGNNTLSGEDGNDYLGVVGGPEGNNTLSGGNGNDVLIAVDFTGNNILSGGNGDDYLQDYHSEGNNTLSGGAGTDILEIDCYYTSGGISTILDASKTNGQITAGSSSITFSSIEQFKITGTIGSDNILGGNGNDTLDGGYGGNDSLNGGAGNDYLSGDSLEIVDGGTGTDTLVISYYSANSGISTTLDASKTNGKITTGNSSVTFSSIEQFNITGTIYSDTLLGGNGNDNFTGNYGNDLLTGGNGADIFYFDSPDQGVDTITDFSVVDDTIQVSAYNYEFGGDLTSEAAIRPEQFVIGSAARDSSDRFIYNQSSGGLFFDADGTGLKQILMTCFTAARAMTSLMVAMEVTLWDCCCK